MLKNRKKYRRLLIVAITSILILSDSAFVAVNYWNAKTVLDDDLLRRADNHIKVINIAEDMTMRNMLQLATHVTHHKGLNQLFLQGKLAVEAEGSQSVEANIIRQKMLLKIQPGWNEMMAKFDVRQLHYHLGPGSLSFLRAHKPDKFGDRMDEVRYTIVDTNATQQQRIGFETGRVYSGLRGVMPVFAVNEANERVYVGAVEVGTSYQGVLKIIDDIHNVGSAILLTEAHVTENMWLKAIEKRFGSLLATCGCFIESTSRSVEETKTIILAVNDMNINKAKKNMHIIQKDNRYYSIYYVPLRDYRGTKNLSLPPVGSKLVWEDVTTDVNNFHLNTQLNILYGIIGFIIVELVLFMVLRIERKFNKMESLVSLDGLTGIPNRRDFELTLSKEMSHAQRNNESLAVIMSDIDYFKPFNDTYGHIGGDSCLQAVAQIMATTLYRKTDYVARYGGEEFVIILPHTSQQQAENITEKLRVAVENLAIEHKGSKVSKVVTMSFGVASATFEGKKADVINLVEQADQALYEAKETTRNCVVGYVKKS